MKKRTMLLLATAFAVFLLIPFTVQVSALQQGPGDPQGPGGPQDPGGPQGPTYDQGKVPNRKTDSNGTVWIDTDIITIKADSQLPSFHFWFTADENGTISKFHLSYVNIVEFEDANGDSAFQRNETLRFAPLAAYEWDLRTGAVVEGDVTTEVWLKYTKSGLRSQGPLHGFEPAMEGPGSARAFEEVTIQIVAHIYLEDYHGNVTDDTGVKAKYTVAGGSELKMDIILGNFPFSTNTSSIALQTLLKENVADGDMNQNRHRYVLREQTRNMTGDSSNVDPYMTRNETRFTNRVENHTQRIDFVDAETSIIEGFFSWVDQAVITWPGGATEAVDVTASYVPTLKGLALYLAYPNFDNGSLLHDPSIGLIEESSPLVTSQILPEVVLVSGITAVGVIALLIVIVVFVRRK